MIATTCRCHPQVLSAGARPGQAALHMRGALRQTHSPAAGPHAAATSGASSEPALPGCSSAALLLLLLQGDALRGARSGAGQGVWAALELGPRRSDEGFWVHPAAADAAIHAGAALRGSGEKGMMVSVAVGYYGTRHALQGAQAIASFVCAGVAAVFRAAC